MKRMFLSILIFVAGMSILQAQISDFPYYKEISASADSKLLAVRLDSDVFAAIEGDFARIRLWGQTEVPYMIEPLMVKETRHSSEPIAIELANLEKKSRDICLIYKKSNRKDIPDSIVINTPLANFEKRVNVYGSSDQKIWKPLIKNQLIFDYSKYIKLRNIVLAIPSGQYAFYKIEIANVTELTDSPLSQIVYKYSGDKEKIEREIRTAYEESFRIEDVVFRQKVSEQITKEPVTEVVVPLKTTIKSDKETVITIDAVKRPVLYMDINVDSSNFYRAVKVDGWANEAWQSVFSGYISDVSTNQYNKKETRLALGSAHSYAVYRITIINDDNPPLAVKSVEPVAQAYRLLFFGDGIGQYKLYYGGSSIKNPSYDINNVISKLDEVEPVLLKTGSAVMNNEYKVTTATGLTWFDNKKLFSLSIILMVVVLGFILIRAAQKVDPGS